MQFKELKNKLFSSNMNLIGAKGRNSVVFFQDNILGAKTESYDDPY